MRRAARWRTSWTAGRQPSRPVVLGAVSSLALLIAAATAVVVSNTGPTAPLWRGDSDRCRTDAMAHVHDPNRLEVLKACSTFTGVVKSVRFVAAFDDVKITLAPTGDMGSYLPAANKGVMVADVIATDHSHVTLPAKGSHVSIWGAWVHDKATKTVMLLPAYRIVVEDPGTGVITGSSAERHAPPVPRHLRLTAHTAPVVSVGGELTVDIRATWSQRGVVAPASQVRLFLEMTTPDGVGARWKAAETDTRGVATVRMAAIQVPATYVITVYAVSAHPPVSVRMPVRITRR